ncbi:hypothetical protein ACFYNO_25805 [Kitasatospora sp. NPDC006697]|uniref:hypothetical protein n=1 Tax=Kitasatospora sp. NPDC006697 TaxID=3364020 RepID=UPI0036A466F5
MMVGLALVAVVGAAALCGAVGGPSGGRAKVRTIPRRLAALVAALAQWPAGRS